jgi:hypothetical protein
MISEYLLKSQNQTLSNTLLDFYLNKNFFANCLTHLNQEQSNTTPGQTPPSNEDILSNLNAKLYIVASFVNLILSNRKFETELNRKKSVYLLNILQEFSNLLVDSLKIDLEEDKNPSSKNNNDSSNMSDEDSEAKSYFKSFEKAIESKLVSIDLLYSISEYFMKGKLRVLFSNINSCTKPLNG